MQLTTLAIQVWHLFVFGHIAWLARLDYRLDGLVWFVSLNMFVTSDNTEAVCRSSPQIWLAQSNQVYQQGTWPELSRRWLRRLVIIHSLCTCKYDHPDTCHGANNACRVYQVFLAIYEVKLFTHFSSGFTFCHCYIFQFYCLLCSPLTSTWPHLNSDVGLEEGEY